MDEGKGYVTPWQLMRGVRSIYPILERKFVRKRDDQKRKKNRHWVRRENSLSQEKNGRESKVVGRGSRQAFA